MTSYRGARAVREAVGHGHLGKGRGKMINSRLQSNCQNITRICASLGLRMKFKTLCYPVFGRNNFYYQLFC